MNQNQEDDFQREFDALIKKFKISPHILIGIKIVPQELDTLCFGTKGNIEDLRRAIFTLMYQNDDFAKKMFSIFGGRYDIQSDESEGPEIVLLSDN